MPKPIKLTPGVIEQICENCGNAFYAWKRDVKKGNSRFCSKQCFETSQYKSISASQGTKQAWEKENVRAKIMSGIKRRSESPEWQSAPQFQKGDSHPKYKGNKQARDGVSRYEYKKWRIDVLKKDNYTCQMCKVRGGKLEAHHVKPWADNPELRYDVSNGQALCEDCHIKIHGKQKSKRNFTCKHCSNLFYSKQYRPTYCSMECMSQAMGGSTVMDCPICGTQVKRHNARLKMSKSGLAFCSKRCAALYREAHK